MKPKAIAQHVSDATHPNLRDSVCFDDTRDISHERLSGASRSTTHYA